MTTVFLGLGSNLGDRERRLRSALAALRALGELLAVSPIYETEPVGFLAQGPFLNAVACLKTALPPEPFLSRLQRLERAAGRQRSVPDGPRTLDLDILFWGQECLQLPALEVPHPRLHRRRFVLAPLCDIAPDLAHPRLGLTARQLLDNLDDPATVSLYRPSGPWPA